jgi:hypothetical protein
MPKRYTHAQLMTVDWYVLINDDMNLQELSDLTSMVDSLRKLHCRYN